MSRPKIFVVSAPSGTGKTTLVKRLKRRLPYLELSISYTTRPARPEEVNGRDYHFIRPRDFRQKVKNGFFIEWAKVFRHYYGTPHHFLKKCLKEKRNVLLVIDTQGAASIKKIYKENARLIFLAPPSLKELEKRLRRRKTESVDSIKNRLDIARKEMEKAKDYDCLVINDKIEWALQELESIIAPQDSTQAMQLSPAKH